MLFAKISQDSTWPNMHVLIGSNLYPHTSDTCQYIQCIDPLWLQPLMLQDILMTSEVTMIGLRVSNQHVCLWLMMKKGLHDL